MISNAVKIKIDGIIVGFYFVGVGLYMYSDMIGFYFKNIIVYEGIWIVIYDEGEENCRWKSISWYEKKFVGIDIIVSVKVINILEELEFKFYI